MQYSFYINLDSRTDRREQFEAECVKMGIVAERFPGVTSNICGLGCAYSHRDVIQLAKDRGYPYVVVFEDDFQFLVEPDEFHNVITSLPEDFDVVMLSYVFGRSEPYNEQYGRVIEASDGSGYIVASKFYDTLLETWNRAVVEYEKTPCHWLFINDASWKPLQPLSRWYYTLKRIGKQRPGWSDNAQNFVDYT